MELNVKRFPEGMRLLRGFICCLLISNGAFAAELAGEWTLTIDTPRGVQHPTLVIEQDGESYSGTYHSLRGPLAIKSISRTGDDFEFPLLITVPIGDIEVKYAGSINGDDLTGTVANPRGEVPFTGKRSEP